MVTDRSGIVQSINQELLLLVGGNEAAWQSKSLDLMFPVASRIFLQTHLWPMLMREGRVREIRLQLLVEEGATVPVFVNCKKTVVDGNDHYAWVLFVTIERSRYEQELLEYKQRAETTALALVKSERFIRTVADAMPSMIAYWDNQLQCQFANKAYSEWAARTPQEMIGLPITTILGEQLYTQNLPHIKSALAGAFQEFEHTLKKPDGSMSFTLVNYVPDKDAAGVVKGFFALVTNISRLREADAAIRLTASVFEATTEGILLTDTAGNIVSVNPAFSELTGYSEKALVGNNANILLSDRHDPAFFTDLFSQLQAKKIWKGEVWSRRKDNSIYLARLSISAICNEDGEVIRYVGICSDITDQWDKEQVVRHMALHDGLTGLPNRVLLMERVGQLIAMSGRESRQIALMFLDLDGFKKVNDTWGHAIGDLVLKTASSRLLGLIRQSDTVARLGGDEFVILLDNPENRESIEMIGARVIAVINEPMTFGEIVTQVGTSIGIAVFQNTGESAEDFLKNADQAMYAAKAAGKSVYRFAT